MKGHMKSCSCTSCAYRSHSKRSSVQHLLDRGTRIDKLFYGKYLPLRERKLLEKLIRTRTVYDGVRDQLLSTSGSSDQTRSEYTFKSQGDDSAVMSRTVSKLVSLIDRGQIRSSNAILSSCCNCCSCSSLKKIKKDMKKHPHVYKKPHVPYENIAKYKLKAEKRARSKRKRIGSKPRDIRFKSRTAYSEACFCTKSLVDMIRKKEEGTISMESSASYTGMRSRPKKPLPKIGKYRKSIGSETPKRFPIKKDSLTLYRDKLRRKRARRKARDRGVEVCDSDTCKHIKKRMKKKHAQDDLICEPGICEPKVCDPEECLQVKEGRKQKPVEECEPGICSPDECDPESCYKRNARRGANIKKKRRHKISGSSKVNASMHAKTLPKLKTSKTDTKLNTTKSTMSKSLKTIKHSSSQSQSSLSTKTNQIEHTLKRCFCTLKLQKKKHSLKRPKSKKNMATLSMQYDNKTGRVRKTQTKSPGIAYVVPPMGTPPRRLLPYECEPFFCTPGECDPLVCEKRIQARFRSNVTHEDGNQTNKNTTRMDTKGIKVHKPRIRYIRSQTIKTEETKETHTEPFLRRCFCTLKLFNKDKSKKKSGTITPSRKHTKPHKAKVRNKLSEASLSSKSSYNKKSKTSISSESLQLESRKREKRHIKHTESLLKGTDNINVLPSSGSKQAVRIGSSFSFNIEFYKEKIPLNQEVVETTKFKRKQLRDTSDRLDIHETKKSRKMAIKARESHHSAVKVKEKGIFVGSATPTCFCTLKLQKKGKRSKTSDQSYDTSKGTETTLELYGPKQNSECKSTSTSKSLRYDSKSFCVPATCDAFESYEEIKRREVKRFSNRNIGTEKRKRKSNMSMTNSELSGGFKARGTQSFVAKHLPYKDKIKYRKEAYRQAVRIGSNFSFNIDFYKDHSAIRRETMKLQNNVINSDLIFKNKTRHMQMPQERIPLKDQCSHVSSMIQKEAFNVGHKLKRCFCTLKLQNKTHIKKENDRNHQWLYPVTTQFMHFEKNNKLLNGTSKFSELNEGGACHLITSSKEKERPCEKSTTKIRFQNGTNNSNQCDPMSRIKIHNLTHVSSGMNNFNLTSSIHVNIESEKNRVAAPLFRQHNQYQVGYLLNNNVTHKTNDKFYRSYYALNLKVSQVHREETSDVCDSKNCRFIDRFRHSKPVRSTGKFYSTNNKVEDRSKPFKQIVSSGRTCDSRNCKFINRFKSSKYNVGDRFRSSKQIGTEGIETRDSMSTTRHKTHKTGISTRSSKSQMRRDRKKINHFKPGKRVTTFGSSMNYNLKFYKDTNSRIIHGGSQQRVSDPYNRRNPSHYDMEKSSNLNKCSSIMRKCFCTMGMGNRRRSITSERSFEQLQNKTRIKNPYGNEFLGKNRANDNSQLNRVSRSCKSILKIKSQKFQRDLDGCDRDVCSKLGQQTMKRGQEQTWAGDYVNGTNKKKKFMSIMSIRKDPQKYGKTHAADTCSCKSLVKSETFKRQFDGCDRDVCSKLGQQTTKRGQEQTWAGDYVNGTNKKKKFMSIMSIRKDPQKYGKTRAADTCSCKSLVKSETFKRQFDGCDRDVCSKLGQQTMKRGQEQSSAGDYVTDIHRKKKSLPRKYGKVDSCSCKSLIKSEKSLRQFDGCDRDVCSKLGQQTKKKGQEQSSAGDYLTDIHRKKKPDSCSCKSLIKLEQYKRHPDECEPDECRKLVHQLLNKGQVPAGDYDVTDTNNRYKSNMSYRNDLHRYGKGQSYLFDTCSCKSKSMVKQYSDGCDPDECRKITQQLLNRIQEKKSEADMQENNKNKFIYKWKDAFSNTARNLLKLEQYQRLLENECDPRKCEKIMRNVIKIARAHYYNTIGKDFQAHDKVSVNKRNPGECEPDECRRVILESLKKDEEAIAEIDLMTRKKYWFMSKTSEDKCNPKDCKKKLEQVKIRKCVPKECEKKLEDMEKKRQLSEQMEKKRFLIEQAKKKKQLLQQLDKERRQKKSTGDHVQEISKKTVTEIKKKPVKEAKINPISETSKKPVSESSKKKRLNSLRTDRAARISRQKYTPDMPDDLKKIMMRPQRSDTVKYGSNFSINIEFFKDSASDLYPSSSCPEKMYRDQSRYGLGRARKSTYGEDTPDVLQNPRKHEELSAVSQVFKKCYCNLKALMGDRGDGPSDSEVDEDICTCKKKVETAICKCKTESEVCKCRKKKKQKHICKCKPKKKKCKCKKKKKTVHICKCQSKKEKKSKDKCKCKKPKHKCECHKYVKDPCKCKKPKHLCECHKYEKDPCKCKKPKHLCECHKYEKDPCKCKKPKHVCECQKYAKDPCKCKKPKHICECQKYAKDPCKCKKPKHICECHKYKKDPCKCKKPKHICKCPKYEKDPCKCKTEETEGDDSTDRRFQDTEQRPGGSFIRRCFCKLRELQDRKSLQLKRSTEIMQSENIGKYTTKTSPKCPCKGDFQDGDFSQLKSSTQAISSKSKMTFKSLCNRLGLQDRKSMHLKQTTETMPPTSKMGSKCPCKLLGLQDETVPQLSTATTPKNKNIICVCKRRGVNDRKSLQLKPSTQTIPSKRKMKVKCLCKRFGLQDRKSMQSKPSGETISKNCLCKTQKLQNGDQPKDMDTIMPYSKRKFKKHSSKTKILDSPCGSCPKSVCPDCGRGEPAEVQKTVDPKKEDEKVFKTKQWCIRVPTFDKDNLIGKFKKKEPELRPLFEMIVDTQTMDVRNKDEILRDLLAGQIKTEGFGYEHMPDATYQGLTLEKGQVEAPVMGFAISKKDKKKGTKGSADPQAGQLVGPLGQPIGPDGQPMMAGGLPMVREGVPIQPAKPRKKTKKAAGQPIMLGGQQMTFGSPPGTQQKPTINKQDKTHHPRGCKCCDCRKNTKSRQKELAATGKISPKKLPRIKPCSCGALICAKETARLKRMQMLDLYARKRTKSCVCGSEICRRQAKLEAQDLQLYFRRKKKAAIKRAKDRQKRLKQYKKEDKKKRRTRKLRDKIAMTRIMTQGKQADLILFSDNVLDVAKFGRTVTCGVVGSTMRVLKRPGDAWYRFKLGMRHPLVALSNISDMIFVHSGIKRLSARLKARFKAMRATDIVVSEMEYHPITNTMVHMFDKKKPKTRKRPRTPLDFNCSTYMGSLRQKPCLFIYYLCPWFYPHCIGCIGLWRQFTDILLFLLAILVWSPCILGMEVLRGLMCCLVCTA